MTIDLLSDSDFSEMFHGATRHRVLFVSPFIFRVEIREGCNQRRRDSRNSECFGSQVANPTFYLSDDNERMEICAFPKRRKPKFEL